MVPALYTNSNEQIYIYVGINYINPLDNSVLEHCDDMERSSPEADVGSMTIKDDLEV